MAGESADMLRRLSLAVSLAAALATDAATHLALATTWPVGRCSDTVGKGGDTLRVAISKAANNDIVDLSTLPATCTGFTLTGGEIPINVGTLSIVSPRNITINGGGNGRIFNHAATGGILYLRYLTLTNGSVASGSGGCVISGGKLTLSHTTITGCQASQDGGGASAASCNIVYSAVDANLANNDAAGLFCSGSDAVFVHSSVSGNLVGGGVFAGSVEAYYSTFANNSRSSNSGGAIYSLTSAKLVHSTVSGNTAGNQGGGVDASFGDVTVQDSVIADNSAGSAGGGIHSHGNVFLTDSTVEGNYAATGGGGVAPFADLIMLRSTLSANSTAGSGGGADADRVTITNSTISGNLAVSGGGLSASYRAKVYNSTIAFNTASGVTAESAGGLVSGKVTMTSSIVAKNSRASAGAADVYVPGAYDFLPTNSLIMSCNRTTLSISSDPRLTPLALHGGSVRTHGLSLSSPAIDAGDAGGLATDQRGIGFSRSVGAAADIGAFERQADDDELFYSGLE